jgi:glycosyltransferase involved in cell wall biosynthesis
MHVIHINLQDGWRGGELQVSFLMLELKKKPIMQTLVCKKGSLLEKFAIDNNFNYLSLQPGFFRGLLNAKKLSQFVRKNNVDIIHCNESKGLGISVWSRILYNNKAKIILHRHVVFPIKGFFSKMIKYSPKYNDKVICISTDGEKVIRDTTNNTNIVIIPSMTNVNYDYKNEHVLEQLGVDVSKKIVGYFAAFTPEKDHNSFLKAAQIISVVCPEVHFVLAGSGELEENIKRFAAELDLTDKVSFLGFVPQAQRLIPEIDVLLFTSTKEGLGTTILEFFVAKKPVVTVKNGGSEDLVCDGETGFICELRDADCLAEKTIRLLQNPQLVTDITQKAYTYALENFSFNSVTEKIYAVYQEVTSKK